MNSATSILLVLVAIPTIALFSYLAVAAWSTARRGERADYYTSEVLKKIAETPGPGSEAALAYLREQESYAAARRRGRLQLSGLVLAAIGIGTMVFLHAIVEEAPVYWSGLIPLLIGAALLGYSYILTPKRA